MHRIRSNMQRMNVTVICWAEDYCFHLVVEYAEPAATQLLHWAFDLFSNGGGTQGFWPLALQYWIGCQRYTVSIRGCVKTQSDEDRFQVWSDLNINADVWWTQKNLSPWRITPVKYILILRATVNENILLSYMYVLWIFRLQPAAG